VGVSFLSAEQACSNAESEVGSSTFEQIQQASQALWNDKLSRVQIDVAHSTPNITQMLYSSLYRSFLTPNNATGEGQGAFEGTNSPYFDSMYTSWDTFRTFYPLLALTSPVEYGEIVENYIDAWRKTGFVPEARCNNLPGWTQGGSNGVNILADFAVKYHNEATKLGVDVNELYAAIRSDGMVNAPEFDTHGDSTNASTHLLNSSL
jgi:putative alpha-1,2-mannosidase